MVGTYGVLVAYMEFLLNGVIMEPYYRDDLVTIYHGLCEDILPELGRVDLVLTDPPYGIRAGDNDSRGGHKHGRAGHKRGKSWAASKSYVAFDDASRPGMELMDQIISMGTWSIVWGGNYFNLPIGDVVGKSANRWLVWDKETGNNAYADCELAWTNLAGAIRIFRFQWKGMLQKVKENRIHPTQKPLPLMSWCLDFLPDERTGERTILDPFMGSGTSLVAAKRRGYQAIGIEKEERFIEFAVQRLQQEYLGFD